MSAEAAVASYTFHTAERLETRTFQCAKCGHRCEAVVRAIGFAGSNSNRALLGVDPAEEAVRLANADAEADVERLLHLAPCPKCGYRPWLATGLYWLRHNLTLVMAAGLFLPIAALGGLRALDGMFDVLLGGLFVFGVVGFFTYDLLWDGWRRFATIAERVVFEP